MTNVEKKLVDLVIDEIQVKLSETIERIRTMITAIEETDKTIHFQVSQATAEAAKKPLGGNGNGKAKTPEKKKRREYKHPYHVDYDEKEFPAVLRAWKNELERRKDDPVTVGQFAAFMGIHPTDTSSYLSGRNRIGGITLDKMAAAFGVTPEEFLKGPVDSGQLTVDSGKEEKQKQTNGQEAVNWNFRKISPVRPKKRKEEAELDPLVAAYCDMCRESGDGYCEGCKVKKALTMAEHQETPGEITLGAKQGACSGCLDYKRGGKDACAGCRLGSFWKAKELVDLGKSLDSAICLAGAEYSEKILKNA